MPNVVLTSYVLNESLKRDILEYRKSMVLR